MYNPNDQRTGSQVDRTSILVKLRRLGGSLERTNMRRGQHVKYSDDIVLPL